MKYLTDSCTGVIDQLALGAQVSGLIRMGSDSGA